MRAVLRYRRWGALLYLLGLSAYILAGAAIVPFHGDESTLIYMGRDFYYLFVTHEPHRVAYSAAPEQISPSAATEQHLRLLNGTIPKMLFGAGAALSGYSFEQLNEQWNWGADWDWNVANGGLPDADMLLRARLISASFLAAGVWLIFWLGYRLGGWWAGLAAATFCALHPALLLNGRRAMMEGPLFFFSLLTLWAGLFTLEKRRWWAFALLGIASGCAIATKHTGAFTAVAVFAGCAFATLINRDLRQRWRFQLGGLLGAGLLTLLVFYALNPAWWGDPLSRAREVLALRNELLSGQISAFGGYASLSEQLAGFVRQGFATAPMYYEVSAWGEYLADQISAYEASGLGGLQFGLASPGTAFLILLAGLGLWHLLRAKEALATQRWPLLAWFAGMLALTALITPLEWQRYYLPFHPALLLCAALGLQQAIRLLLARRSA